MTVPQKVKLARHPIDLDDDGHEFVELGVTTETDTSLVLAPDGIGGVGFRAETGGGGSALEVLDEGTPLDTAVTSIDFTGTGVTASAIGHAITVTVPGGGGSGIYFNVVDYGAVGDDSTDDTTAIQAAIDAAELVNGTVYFPATADAYKITATLTIDAQISILGEGGGGFDNPGPVIRMNTANTTAFETSYPSAYDVSWKNLYIKGPGSASSGSGIYGHDRNIYCDTIRVQGFFYGIRIGPSSFYSKLIKAFIRANANANVLVESGATDIELYACRLDGSSYGIKADGCHSIRVYGGSMEANSYGYYGTSGNQATLISGVYFEDNSTNDIAVGVASGDKSVLIEGCLFTTNSTTRSIDAGTVDRLSVIGCFFDAAHPAGDDIRTTSSSTYVLLGNNTYSGAGVVLAGPAIDLDPSDTTLPSATGSAAHGTSKYLAPIDHVHASSGSGVTYGTPAIVLGTAASAGSIDEAIRRDSTVVAFDATVPVTQAFSDTAATGSAAVAARRDHKHGMPATPTVSGGTLVIASSHSTPLVFGDLIQNSAQDDLVYSS